jgi:integrase
MILKRHIRPALKRLNIAKKIGWHSFRHGFSNLLRENKVEIKTAQELLRHANSRITLDIYQQTVTEERRSAQKMAVNTLLGGGNLSTLEHPDCDGK